MIENRGRLLLAGFLTLIAAGIGFGVRGGLLEVWAREYGFTYTELGQITGGGLLGFGIIILFAGMLIDSLGYKKLLLLALACHVASAVMLFFADGIYRSLGQSATYQILWLSALVFAIGNGLCEAVINPLTAAVYPEQKTHYLNILHAGWPGGLVIGGLIALGIGKLPWELLLAAYLVPAAIYGYLTLTERFPQTDAQKGEISYLGMLRDCLVPFFLLLLAVHAMVGYVELGTDSWIARITGSILADPQKGILLFIYTSMLMFALRFFAGPIVHRISSLGLLLASACVGALGLYLIGAAQSLAAMVVAVTIYGLGKTFLWPTMLGVVGENFPHSATVAMALLGFAGMTSAGLLGGPGIGYKQDRFAAEKLEELSPEAYQRYQASGEKHFLFLKPVQGLDGRKVGVVADSGAKLAEEKQIAEQAGTWDSPRMAPIRELDQWWQTNQTYAAEDLPQVEQAGLYGGRMAIQWTAIVPSVMAACYLLMLLIHRSPADAAAPHAH